MKESITKFDLEAAFKALDEIEAPIADKVKANRPALTEIFSRKSKFDALMEEYYDINDMAELDSAKDAREAEVAQAKLARIEKIVDLDAESPEDLLPSYVGKFIMQCPQCMTLFYKDPEDVEASEEDPNTVNVSEICQHCGNDAGYTLIGKVGEATQEETAEFNQEETVDVESAGEVPEEDSLPDEEAFDLDLDTDAELDELDLNLDDEQTEEEEPEEEKKEESFNSGSGEQALIEALVEETELEVSADEFETLITSPEFKKPISDSEARSMIDELNDEKDSSEEVKESIQVNNEIARYAVINPDGTYAGVPCTSEEEARELAAQKEGRVIAELVSLKEGIFDKLRGKFASKVDKIVTKLKSREEKADWVLANTLTNYDNIQVDNNGELEQEENNKKFNTFVVVGYKDTYRNGKQITVAPTFNNKDLVVGMERAASFKKYADADKYAKGWSLRNGNGPAFIYMAKTGNDTKAAFLCEYFKGELNYDQLEKYVKVVKDDLAGAELMSTSNADQEVAEELVTQNKDLDTIMNELDELDEAKLEDFIASSLVEAYGNIAGYRLTECTYINEKFTIDGTIYFTSGNKRKTTYTFTEAYRTIDDKIEFSGLNEKLGADKHFIITGRMDDNKTFITESFKYTKQ